MKRIQAKLAIHVPNMYLSGVALERLETVKPPLTLHYFRLLVIIPPSSDSLSRRRAQKVARFVGLLPSQPSDLTELCI